MIETPAKMEPSKLSKYVPNHREIYQRKMKEYSERKIREFRREASERY